MATQNMSTEPNMSVAPNMSTPNMSFANQTVNAPNMTPMEPNMSTPEGERYAAPPIIKNTPSPAPKPTGTQEIAPTESPQKNGGPEFVNLTRDQEVIDRAKAMWEAAQKTKQQTETAPATAETTSKVNPDGSTTTETKDFATPEAQEYKKQLDDSLASIDTEIQYAKSKFEGLMANADDAQANLIRSIEKTFEVRKYEMERINKAALNTQQLLGSRSGRQRYAPEIQSSILSEEERAGLVRMTEIEALELQTIATAQSAAVEQDFMLLNGMMNTLQGLRGEKNDIMQNMYNLSVQEEQRAQQRAKFALDMEQYQNEIVSFQMQNESAYASAAATSLVTFDEEFNISPPTQAEIQEAAANLGIDPNLLSQAVFQQIQELQTMGSDQYGTFFERQKFAAELAQIDFENSLAVQRHNLEERMFGFKVSEAGYVMQNGELVNVRTGESGGALEWAKQIAAGKLKMSDVPADLRTSVVAGLNSLPPKKEDIAKTEQKISSLEQIINHPGLDESVGPQKVTRLDWWAFSGAKQSFIGDVQQLLSEKTLQSLIDAKADGATFGALSEGELRILEAAATKIGTWAVRNEEGQVVGYKVSEKEFKNEIERIKDEYESLVVKSKEQLASEPYTGPADFTQRASEEDKKLWQQFNADPSFQNATTQDLIDAVNAANGFTGERGGALLGFAIKENFPTGTVGGQCGTFAHKIVDFPPVGDRKEEKFASVDKFGIPKSQWTPKVGDVIITNEHPTWGHVAVVNSILPDGKLVLSESNYKSDERVTNDRIIDYSSPKIYGAIRGSYKV